MLDENTRTAIALKKFSLISPIVNGQFKNNSAYYIDTTKDPIDMPYIGARKYSPKTLECWYLEYIKYGIDALKPEKRADRGRFRKIDTSIGEKIAEVKNRFPRAPVTVLYETLVAENSIDPLKVSKSTIYRFLKNSNTIKIETPEKVDPEMKRFSHQFPGELWQTDIMYGPYINFGKRRAQTFLSAFIDDATRLITHAQFYHLQNFETLRHSFKEAVLKRGIPKLIYTDNGKIYRSQQFEWLCAGIGSTLIHARPFEPNSKGKVERFFHTVRNRFLSKINPEKLPNIDELNKEFWKWLDEDYQKKPHSALDGLSPLDSYIADIHKVNLPSDPVKIKEQFYLRIQRKINPDGTLSLDKLLYETNISLANSKVEIRYEPEWVGIATMPLLIYKDDKLLGEARLVNFHDNAHMRRRGRITKDKDIEFSKEIPQSSQEISNSQTISFKEILKGDF